MTSTAIADDLYAAAPRATRRLAVLHTGELPKVLTALA